MGDSGGAEEAFGVSEEALGRRPPCLSSHHLLPRAGPRSVWASFSALGNGEAWPWGRPARPLP